MAVSMLRSLAAAPLAVAAAVIGLCTNGTSAAADATSLLQKLEAGRNSIWKASFHLAPPSLRDGAVDEGSFEGCPTLEGAGCLHSGDRPVAAVYIVGTKQRLTMASTLQHVVRRMVDDGFDVRVYMSLVFNASGTGAWQSVRKNIREDPATEGLDRDGLRRHLKKVVRAAGACLVCADLPLTQLRGPAIPIYKNQMTHFFMYGREIGYMTLKRCLDLWRRREQLWQAMLQHERASGRMHEVVMWTRDTSIWMGDMPRPSQLLQAPGWDRTVMSKKCGASFGINDRVVILGRRAAPALFTLYSAYMGGGFPDYRTMNSESFVMGAAKHAKTTLVRNSTSFEVIPESDGMWVDTANGRSMCMAQAYWCGGDVTSYGLSFCPEPRDRPPLPATKPAPGGS